MTRSDDARGTLRGLLARWPAAVVLAAVAFAAGYAVRWGCAPAGPTATRPPGSGEKPASAPVTEWTCSMHPEVRRPRPGRCPKCGMDLVPVRPAKTGGLREFITTEAAKALMDIEVAPVRRTFVEAAIRMVGKIDYDETRLAAITAWVPGRLEELHVDYTGVPVRKGVHMVEIYSPELLGAQEELIQALRSLKALRDSDAGVVRDTAETTVAAAREKLRLLGLTAEQVAEIERTGKASDHLTINAPASGIVVHKHAKEGMYVNTGTRIYTIADLSQVWVKLDAYESDLMWLRYGQEVAFRTVSYPGETFTGRIALIDPILTPRTRTVKLRVNAPNEGGRLKPGMFVKAEVRARVAAAGQVMDPALAGKWICEMHPDVVKDHPGRCDVCRMPLVRTESLGYVSADADEADKPLVVPASAVLKTGTRAVVYVARPAAEEPTYEGREIVLGPRAGDYYIVRRGLTEGERVVVRGNFKIDSALQIQARPSMMSPGAPAAAGETPELPSLFRHQLGEVLKAASAAERALSKGRTSDAVQGAFADMAAKVKAVDADLPAGRAASLWQEYSMRLLNDAAEARAAQTPQDLSRVVSSLRRNARQMASALGLAGARSARTRPAVGRRFLEELRPVFTAYLEVHEALARDRAADAAAAAAKALTALERMEEVPGDKGDQSAWSEQAAALRKAFGSVAAAKDLVAAREAFVSASEQLFATARRFGPPPGLDLFGMNCPMAFDNRGARWLQSDRQVRNPYFGAAMPRCGEVVEVIEAPPADPADNGHNGHQRP